MATKTKRPTTRAERRAKNPAVIPARYTPRFLEGMDNRLGVVRKLKAEVVELIEATGADNPPQLQWCEEVVWLRYRLSKLRAEALTTGKVNDPVMTQMTNTLSGMLNRLGFDNKEAKELALSDLLDEADD